MWPQQHTITHSANEFDGRMVVGAARAGTPDTQKESPTTQSHARTSPPHRTTSLERTSLDHCSIQPRRICVSVICTHDFADSLTRLIDVAIIF